MELAQQVAQVLYDSNITAAESVEQLEMAIKGLVKMGVLALGGGALGTAAVAGKDALSAALAGKEAEEAEIPLQKENEGTLEELITQAIQEELAGLASKK